MEVKFIGKIALRDMDEQDVFLALKIAADHFSNDFKDSNAVVVANWLDHFISNREAGEIAPLHLSARVVAWRGFYAEERWPDFLKLAIALGAPDLIFSDIEWWYPKNVSILESLPLAARRRFISLAYDTEEVIEQSREATWDPELDGEYGENKSSLLSQEVLDQIGGACADSSEELALTITNGIKGVGGFSVPIHSYIQLLPNLRRLTLPGIDLASDDDLWCIEALKHIPLEARKNLILEISSQRLPNPHNNADIGRIIDACEKSSKQLTLSLNNFDKLAILTNLLPDLQELTIRGGTPCGPKPIAHGIARLTRLENLTIDGFLGYLTMDGKRALAVSDISDLSAMQSCVRTSLKELNINGLSSISSLDYLHCLSRLRKLSISFADSLEFITALDENEIAAGASKELRELSISRAPELISLEGLHAPQLETLRLSWVEQLTDLSALRRSPALRRIFLRGQNVQDLLGMLAILPLPVGTTIYEEKVLLSGSSCKLEEVELGSVVTAIPEGRSAFLLAQNLDTSITANIGSGMAAMADNLSTTPEWTAGNTTAPQSACGVSIYGNVTTAPPRHYL